MNKFASTVTRTVTDHINPIEEFKDYDYWEEYSGEYSKEKVFDKKTYTPHLYIFQRLLNNSTDEKRYVVYVEVYDPLELKTLMEFCQCNICQLYWFDPSRLIMCRCCYGCIKTLEPIFMRPDIVKQARLRRCQKPVGISSFK